MRHLITRPVARRLVCDAGVVRILTDPAGLPLDVGAEQRCEGGFTITPDPGTATWPTYRPGGTEIHIRAEAVLRAPP